MTESRSRCLVDLFRDEWDGVLIPIVQRDYAQGRPSSATVREHFLAALYRALERAGTGAPPLDLDFVYGYAAEGTRRFVPIDGQQRLTTLFLLHWFLAIRDDELEDFRTWALAGRGARFHYAVRDSSDDFLRDLAIPQISGNGFGHTLARAAEAASSRQANADQIVLRERIEPL